MESQRVGHDGVHTQMHTYIRFHSHMESKRQNKLTKITKQKESHRYREQTAGCSGEAVREGEKWMREVKRYKLSVTK